MGVQFYFAAVQILILFMTSPSPRLVNGLSMDELIFQAQGENSLADTDVMAEIDASEFRQELDMILIKEQFMALREGSSRKKRKAIKNRDYRWAGKVIPYKLASNVFTSNDRREITSAINEWQEYTCLKFKTRTSENNYVHFKDGSGCYSYVGMVGGGQDLGLAPGCRRKGVIVHEIGHAVGFHHEQNRPDRDDHVIINRENIPSNLYYNFKKYPYSAVDVSVPYDYGSVMHYGSTAFSINGQLTIRTKNAAYQNVIGNREGLSFNDIWMANRIYKCDERCSGENTCSGRSYRGEDCKCYCPAGSGDKPAVLCDDDGTGSQRTTPGPPTTTTPSSECQDFNQYCSGWADGGYCRTNNYVATYCKKSCGSCRATTKPPICIDKETVSDQCPRWKESGFCTHPVYNTYMTQNCPRTCNECPSNSVQKDDDNNGAGPVSAGALSVLLGTVLAVFTCGLRV